MPVTEENLDRLEEAIEAREDGEEVAPVRRSFQRMRTDDPMTEDTVPPPFASTRPTRPLGSMVVLKVDG
jgi:hypothetical protein